MTVYNTLIMDHYQAALDRHDIIDSPAQRAVLPALQRILDTYSGRFLWSWKYVRGFYIQGKVGVGKTFLMDLFYRCIQDQRKARHHFHDFMHLVDTQLRSLQGQRDPLQKIAKIWAKNVRILCLDELLVEDIAHAMILAELLQALIKNGVILVVTSNSLPDHLYYQGLQRVRFLPAIALLKRHCEVCILQDDHDHRLGHDIRIQSYVYPMNQQNTALLVQYYQQLTHRVREATSLEIENRSIACEACGDKVVWFSFKILCSVPRSQLDYLAIAQRFHTVFLSEVSPLTSDSIVLFIRLIDVLYDQGIRLLILAEVPLEQLYTALEYADVFQRTYSRLSEMQSQEYWQKHAMTRPGAEEA